MLGAALTGFDRTTARRSAPGSRAAKCFWFYGNGGFQAAIDDGVFGGNGHGGMICPCWRIAGFVTERKHRDGGREQQDCQWRNVTALAQSRRALIAKMARAKLESLLQRIAAFRTEIALVKRATHGAEVGFSLEPMGWRGEV
jgi:hypothetical protein